MFERVIGQLSPANLMMIGLLALIAGKQIDFIVLMLLGAAVTTLGVVQLWKAAKQPE
jgi:hypothetical protein